MSPYLVLSYWNFFLNNNLVNFKGNIHVKLDPGLHWSSCPTSGLLAQLSSERVDQVLSGSQTL